MVAAARLVGFSLLAAKMQTAPRRVARTKSVKLRIVGTGQLVATRRMSIAAARSASVAILGACAQKIPTARTGFVWGEYAAVPSAAMRRLMALRRVLIVAEGVNPAGFSRTVTRATIAPAAYASLPFARLSLAMTQRSQAVRRGSIAGGANVFRVSQGRVVAAHRIVSA